MLQKINTYILTLNFKISTATCDHAKHKARSTKWKSHIALTVITYSPLIQDWIDYVNAFWLRNSQNADELSFTQWLFLLIYIINCNMNDCRIVMRWSQTHKFWYNNENIPNTFAWHQLRNLYKPITNIISLSTTQKKTRKKQTLCLC